MWFSLRCIQVIAGVLGRAGEAGTKQRLEAADRGVITYRPAQGLRVPGEDEDGNPAPTPAEAKPLEQESIENAEEIEAKLDAAQTHDGRRLGHRVRVSA